MIFYSLYPTKHASLLEWLTFTNNLLTRFWNMRNTSSHLDKSYPERLTLSYSTAGTRHGLSKVPYFRDTRRALGIDGWRLMHEPLRDTYGPTGTHFKDAVALGDYNGK